MFNARRGSRSFASRLALVTTLMLCACREAPPDASEATADPALVPLRNVILICIDTVRWDVFRALDDLGEDSLATWSQRAMRFDQTQSTAPWTVPAVASVLTGVQPQRHGAGYFPNEVANLAKTLPSALSERAPSLPELLLERGFRTRAFVAHPWFRAKFGLWRGFRTVGYDAQDKHVMQKVSAWLDSAAAQGPDRFMLYVHLMRAHQYLDWDAGEIQKLVARLTPAETQSLVSLETTAFCARPEGAACQQFLAYGHSIVRLRRQIAGLLARLESRGLLSDTLVVLFADHGEEFRDHVLEQKQLEADPRGVYGIGHGQSLYQELLQVPLMVWHSGLKAGRSDEPASLVDIAPSAISWLGLDAGEVDFDGRVLLASDAPSARPRYSTGISFGPQQYAVVRDGWKRVLHGDSGVRELFELKVDPQERVNADAPDVARELDLLLDAYAAAARESPGDAPMLDDESLRALQSLGYLEEANGP